jgi:transposase InsO family protein
VEEQRAEFVRLALQADVNFSELCRRFDISRKTGYKWLSRDRLSDQSRRPLSSPARTPSQDEAQVVLLRQAHPAWGGRKIAKVLARDTGIELTPSTVTRVLHRHGLISSEASQAATAWKRFEHPRPNSLWQMDFKGHIAVGSQRAHPLTVIDDHSRFNIALDVLAGETTMLVRAALQRAFERYGLPECINTDNGPPWGSGGGGITQLNVWTIRLGIRVSHSAPCHPQTNGKDERFHRTLKAELLSRYLFEDLAVLQLHCDRWRMVYNCKRPHEAIGMLTPAERYTVSPRPMPATLPPIEYAPGGIVRSVQAGGIVKFQGRRLRTSLALHGQPIALRPLEESDGVYDVFFCNQWVDQFDLRAS